jgi:hypothetical protein
MAIEDNNLNSPKVSGKSKANYALYAIAAVGVLYIIVRILLHLKYAE